MVSYFGFGDHVFIAFTRNDLQDFVHCDFKRLNFSLDSVFHFLFDNGTDEI